MSVWTSQSITTTGDGRFLFDNFNLFEIHQNAFFTALEVLPGKLETISLAWAPIWTNCMRNLSSKSDHSRISLVSSLSGLQLHASPKLWYLIEISRHFSNMEVRFSLARAVRISISNFDKVTNKLLVKFKKELRWNWHWHYKSVRRAQRLPWEILREREKRHALKQ